MKKSQFRASLLAASALSVSIASQIHAAAFVSTAVGGTWEDPASWTAAAGFPDTFGADSAIIAPGATITYDDFGATPLNGGGVSTPPTPFTIALGLNPGGLSVANGNSITINGAGALQGVLTQATLLNEIRIGEGKGATSGVGTLNIDGGGIFLSGSSLGVAVGSDIDSNVGNGTGNGVVNLKNGLFIMEVGGGPSTAGLGVGIEGATGVFNVGDGAGAAGEAILDLKTNNNNFGAGVTNQLPGSTLAGNGTVNVKSDGLLTFGTGTLTFGDTSTGVGILNVDGGTVGEGAGSTGAIRIGIGGGSGVLTVTSGVINSGGDLSVGRGAGSTGLATISGGTTLANHLIFGDGGTGTVNLSGATTQLNSTLNLNVGTNGGIGHINQTGGAVTYSQWSAIGVGAGAAGSSWDISGGSITSGAGFEVGSDRDGTFNVSGTAVVSVGPLEAGIRSGSNGHINITSGTVTTTRLGIAGSQGGGAAGDATISGTANLTITGGGGQSYIGNNAGSVGTVNVNGVTVNNVSGQDWQIGFNGGTGTLNIVNGGVVKHNWWLNIARGGASTGTVTVDGPTSKVILDGNPGPGGGGDINWNVGEDGTGTMTVKNGASVDHDNANSYRSHVGRNNGSHGFLNVESSATVATMEIFAGTNGGATGEINIKTGGKVTMQQWMEVGSRGGVGTINIDGPGSTFENIGGGDGRNGGRGGDAQVGYEGGTGNINVTNGGLFKTGWWLNIARGGSSTGNVLVDGPGSKIIVGTTGGDVFLNAGEDGTGNMTISNGGLVQHNGAQSYRTRIGANGGSHGTVNVVSGGQFDTTELFVANSGNSTGTLNILSGGKVTVQNWLTIGQGGGSVGTVSIDGAGSALISRSPIFGRNGGNGGDNRIGSGGGSGTVNVTNGGQFDAGHWTFVGLDGGSQGTLSVDGAGSTAFVGGQMRVGQNGGTGTLSVANGGSYTGNDENYIGVDSGSTGTLTLGAGTVAVNHWLNVGRAGGNGTVTQTDGTFTVRDEARIGIKFGGEAPGTGTLNLSGGTFTVGRETVVGGGTGSTGTMNVSGTGTLTSGGELQVGNNGGTGVAHISGGTVIAKSYVAIGRSQPFEIANYATADQVIAGGPIRAYSVTANYTTSNTQDNGDGGGPFGLGVQLQGLPGGDNNDFAFVGLGNFTVGTTGSYIFGNNTDDGSRLRLSINGGLFTDIITDNVLSGPHTVSSAAQTLTAGDTIALEWMWFERGGGAEGETFYNRDAGPNALWEDSTQGLTLVGGQYSGTVYKAGGTGGNGTVNLSANGKIMKVADNGGSFDIGSWNGGFANGPTTSGTLNQTGGIVEVLANDTYIGRDTGTVGVWNMSGGSAALRFLVVGNAGNGTLNITNPSASIVVSAEMQVGRNGGRGEVHQSAGTVSAGGGWFGIANDGTGSSGLYDISGGSLTVTAGTIELGADGVGELRVSGTGQVTANRIAAGFRAAGNGTLAITGGSVTANDRVTVGNAGAGTAKLNGGVLKTNYIEAGGGSADLSFDGGTLQALSSNADFIRGFTNSGGHSAIKLLAGDGTIDSNGFDVRITAANVISNPGDTAINGLLGTVLNKKGAGQLTLEGPAGDGFLAVHAIAGILDFESDQTLDALVIENGAIVTISALSSPPAPAQAAGALFEESSSLSATPVQGVPEPGTIGLLLASALGMMGRRNRRKES